MRDYRKLDTIQNNDSNNIIHQGSGQDMTPDEYRRAVHHLLDGEPSALAQCVGMPDPVTYETKVATTWDKHIVETSLMEWGDRGGPEQIKRSAGRQADAVAKLRSMGTDPLELTIEVCRERGVLILAIIAWTGKTGTTTRGSSPTSAARTLTP